MAPTHETQPGRAGLKHCHAWRLTTSQIIQSLPRGKSGRAPLTSSAAKLRPTSRQAIAAYIHQGIGGRHERS